MCFSVAYTAIQRATNDGSNLLLEVVSDDGAVNHHQLRLGSRLLANALYRALTEKYYFYHCDTVGTAVMVQSSRDFKGTLASLFSEKTEMGSFQAHFVPTERHFSSVLCIWLCDALVLLLFHQQN